VIIVGGTFEVEPDQREAFMASRLDAMVRSRAEAGCLDYTFAADPIVPGRVILFERWESQEHLDAHLAAPHPPADPDTPAVSPISVSIVMYDVAGERTLV
jgi:quinol monooxygenase YgiN